MENLTTAVNGFLNEILWQKFSILDFLGGSRYVFGNYPAGNDMFKVNNENTRKSFEICSTLTIMSLLLTLNIFHTLL